MSSGLLLDLLAELGSLGGVIPDILTQTTQNSCELRQLIQSDASSAQRPQAMHRNDKDDRCVHYAVTNWDCTQLDISTTSAKMMGKTLDGCK